MATPFQFSNAFSQALANAKHNFEIDTFKVALTNQAFNPAWETLAAFTEISDTVTVVDPPGVEPSGYTEGGNTVLVTSQATVNGVYRVIFSDPAQWQAESEEGPMGPFRTAVLYNSSSLDLNIVGGWDNVDPIELALGGDPFRLDLSQVNGVLTIQVAAQ